MDLESQPFDLRDLLWRVSRYRWLLALPPVAVICIASIYYATSPTVYESHVTVSLGEQAAVGSGIQSMVNTDRDRSTSSERLALVDSRVRSRGFLNLVAERLGLLSDPEIQTEARAEARRHAGVPADEISRRIASARIVKKIRVAPLEGVFVRVTTTGETPEGAQRLASTIMDLLIEGSRRSSLERVQARGEFSQDQLIVQQERVRDAENALQQFQETILRRSITRTPVTDSNLDDAQETIRATDQEIEQTRDRVELTRQQWHQYAPGVVPPDLKSKNTDELERRLVALETSMAVATSRPEGTAREVTGLQASIAAARQTILLEFEGLAAALPGDHPDAARTALAGLATDRAILRSLRSKRERLSSYIAQFARAVESSPREQMELARLRAAVDTGRELLASIQREAQSARISEALASSAVGPRLTVIDPPQLPFRRSAPDPLRIFGGALLLGPLLSAGIVIGGEKVALVIRTVEQAEQEMGARVLGIVPRIEGWVQREAFFARNWAFLSIVLVIVITGVFHGLNATILSQRPQGTESAPTIR